VDGAPIARTAAAAVVGDGPEAVGIAVRLARAGARARLIGAEGPSPAEGVAIVPAEGLEEALTGVDWIVEASADPAGALARIDAAIGGRDDPLLVTTAAAWTPLAELAEGRSPALRRRLVGLRVAPPPARPWVAELVVTEATDRDAAERAADLASRRLGAAAVRVNDRPGRIVERLGLHGLMTAMRLGAEHGLGADEVDELAGPLLGRARGALRALDAMGLDAVAETLRRCRAALPDDPERDAFVLAPTVVAAGALFRREADRPLALDLATGEHRLRRRIASDAVAAARAEPDLGARMARLVAVDEPAGRFLRDLLTAEARYAVRVVEEVAPDGAALDRAMRAGFGREMGPLETWAVIARAPAPPRAGPPPGGIDPVVLRRGPARREGDADASILELGDGLLGVELHGGLNLLRPSVQRLIARAVELAADRYDGLVIGATGPDFSAGADLGPAAAAAEAGDWDAIERALREIQAMMRAIRGCQAPVVAAPRGHALGGGAEICLAAARRQPLADVALGLPEARIGLIPAAGGVTALARRVAASAAHPGADALPAFLARFREMVRGRPSASAEEALAMGLLEPGDLVTADPERQWGDAARVARALAEAGHRPPPGAPIPVLGRRGTAACAALTHDEVAAGRMTAHDRVVALELARVLAGGDVPAGTAVSEAHLMDLEREAFLRLLGTEATRARIRHTLATGRPLRN
jgi:3-hydroxyacyl-CoA dehydrogenase